MTVTDVTVETLVKNSNVAQSAGTTLVVGSTNYMRVVTAFPERLVLRVSNTDGAVALDFVVRAGDNPPALRAGQGNLTTTVAAGGTVVQYIGPFESDKYLQSDGALEFWATTVTGKVWAILLPRG